MSINSHISRSVCFSWHTKCHRAFDESLRSGCVTANKFKSAITCFQPEKVLPLTATIKRGKLWPWPCRSWAGNRIISLLDTFPLAVGLVTLLLTDRQRGKSLQRRGTLHEFSRKTVCAAAEFYSSAGFLINFSLTRLTVTSNPARKEWGKHNKKTGKQHPLFHIDKRQSFAAHLKLSGVTNGEIQLWNASDFGQSLLLESAV